MFMSTFVDETHIFKDYVHRCKHERFKKDISNTYMYTTWHWFVWNEYLNITTELCCIMIKQTERTMLQYKLMIIVSILVPTWGIEPAIYSASISSSKHCDFGVDTNELNNIIGEIKRKITPVETFNSDALLESVLKENTDITSFFSPLK